MGLHTFIGQYPILRHVVKVYWFSCFAFILLQFVFVRVHHKRKSPKDLLKPLSDSYTYLISLLPIKLLLQSIHKQSCKHQRGGFLPCRQPTQT